jgi:hypothetical protein
MVVTWSGFVQELIACLWPAQSIPWMVVSVYLYFAYTQQSSAFSLITLRAVRLCLLPMV